MADQMGINARDIILGVVGLIMTLMGWIFNRQDKRLTDLETCKVDKTTHEDKFAEVIRRLDAQDVSSATRDLKLDRIIERLIK
jgi:hypothetical protein